MLFPKADLTENTQRYSVYSVIFSIFTVAKSPRDSQILLQNCCSLLGFNRCLNYVNIGILQLPNLCVIPSLHFRAIYYHTEKQSEHFLGEKPILILVKYKHFPYLSIGLTEYKQCCPLQYASDF